MGNRLAVQGAGSPPPRGAYMPPPAAVANMPSPAPPAPPTVLQRLSEHDGVLSDHHAGLTNLESRISRIESALGLNG